MRLTIALFCLVAGFGLMVDSIRRRHVSEGIIWSGIALVIFGALMLAWSMSIP